MNKDQAKKIGGVVLTALLAVGAMFGVDVATEKPAVTTTAYIVSGEGIEELPLDGRQPQVTLAEGQGVLLLVGGVPATFIAADPQAAAPQPLRVLDQINADAGDPPPKVPYR